METTWTVLLIEDSPGDVQLTQEILRGADDASCLHVAADGAEAITFLGRGGSHLTQPLEFEAFENLVTQSAAA